MTRQLNGKESADAGFAVGVMIELTERIVKGEIYFTDKQLKMITRATKILGHFTIICTLL